MTEQKNNYTATESVYKENLNKILSVDAEIKELNADKRNIILNAEKDGCNPKILRQMVRLSKMQQADQAALADALEIGL